MLWCIPCPLCIPIYIFIFIVLIAIIERFTGFSWAKKFLEKHHKRIEHSKILRRIIKKKSN